MGLFNNFPYSDLNNINLDYTLNKLNDLYERGQELYAELQEWKQDTDEEVTTWINETNAALEDWKVATSADLSRQVTNELTSAKSELLNTVSAGLLIIEGTAYGTQNGEPVEEDSPYYHNNCVWYKEQAVASAIESRAWANGENASPLFANNNSKYFRQRSEAWAVGQINGADVPDTDDAYNNNAKYYATQIGNAVAQIATNTGDIANLKNALSSEDIFINDTLSYVNYGYNNSYYQARNPSGTWRQKIGIKRDMMVVTIDKPTAISENIVIKITGDVELVATNADTDAWTTGLTLIPNHVYKIKAKLISGTCIYDSQSNQLMPVIHIYKTGTHSSAGTGTRPDSNTYERIFTSDPDSTTKYNIAIYLTSNKYLCTDATFLITLEDQTISTIYNIQQDIKELNNSAIITNEISEIKNILYVTDTTSRTINGVDISIDPTTGYLTLNGTASGGFYIYVMGDDDGSTANLPIGTYSYTNKVVSGEYSNLPTFRYRLPSATGIGTAFIKHIPTTFETAQTVFIYVANGRSFTNTVIGFQLEKVETADEYLPPDAYTAKDMTARYDIKKINDAIPYFLSSPLTEEQYNRLLKSIDNSNMLFCAHQGMKSKALPNTLLAFELAGKYGYDYINIAQCRQSYDGTWWAQHDATIDNDTNGTGAIAELTDTYLESLVRTATWGDEYSADDFTDDQKRMAKVEDIIITSFRFKTKIIFRLGSLPSDNTGANADAWTSFVNLIKKYNIQDESIFSGTEAQLVTLRSYFPNANIAIYGDEPISTASSHSWTTNIWYINDTNMTAAKCAEIHAAGIKVIRGKANATPTDLTNYLNDGTEMIMAALYWMMPM